MATTIDHSDRDRSDDPELDQVLGERHRIEQLAGDDLAEADAEAILDFLDALDPQVGRVSPGDIGTKEYSTLSSYGQSLRLVAERIDGDLVDQTTDSLNAFMDTERERLSDNTLSARQTALRVFFRWLDSGVAPGDIAMVATTQTKVDERYVFSRDEVDAMRGAIENARDRALFELLLWSGQRIRAILSLRAKDINLEDGTFYLNTETSGLKGASGPRPILSGAKAAVADWYEYHQANYDQDAYFITKLPESNKGDPHSMLYRSTVQRRLKSIGERAGIENWEERVHPHNFRHTFVRWAKVHLDMDDDEIRWMLGQSEGSRIMETTYKHLSDEDYLKRWKGEQPDEQGDITPLECDVCGAPLPDGAVVCSRCTTPVTPDGYRKQQEAQRQVGASTVMLRDEIDEDEIEELAENEAVMNRLVEIYIEKNS